MPPSVQRVAQVERELETGDYTLDEMVSRTGLSAKVIADALSVLRQSGVQVVKRYHLSRREE